MSDEAATGQGEANSPIWNPEVAKNFFAEWNKKHLEAGIFPIYNQEARDFVESFLQSDVPEEVAEGEVILQATSAELPLGVMKETDVFDQVVNMEEAIVVAEELGLVKTDPVTGMAVRDSQCSIGHLYPDGTLGERNEAFTAEQAQLLIDQYKQQQQLGLIVGHPTNH